MAVRCRNCRHFRSAPYEAPHTGCYLPKNMESKQDQAFLDQQQLPGDHRAINRRGDCADFEARARRPSLWQRLFSQSA